MDFINSSKNVLKIPLNQLRNVTNYHYYIIFGKLSNSKRIVIESHKYDRNMVEFHKHVRGIRLNLINMSEECL